MSTLIVLPIMMTGRPVVLPVQDTHLLLIREDN